MSKFGELIAVNVPVLLEFYTTNATQTATMQTALRDVVATLGNQVKVLKIDVDKNQKLAEALRVKGLPTLMIYKNKEMKWRQSGEQDADTLISLLKEYIA